MLGAPQEEVEEIAGVAPFATSTASRMSDLKMDEWTVWTLVKCILILQRGWRRAIQSNKPPKTEW